MAAEASPTETYRVLEPLKKGGRTTLYRAVRNSDLLPVVIKTLNADRTAAIDTELLRAEFEVAKRLAGLSTVVQAEGFIYYEGNPAIVFEDFGGVSLDETLAEKGMDLGQFLRLAVAMARALGEVHDRHVVHRDVKPQNFILASDARDTDPTAKATAEGTVEATVKLTDFGISRVLRNGSSVPSSGGLIEGSLPYISPEQTGRMNRPVDFRSDLYSLGATFYQMLTGELLCGARDPLEWIHCHIARSPDPLGSRSASGPVPAMVERIVQKLLSKLAEDRYQSAFGLLRDLERCRDEWERSRSISEFPLGEGDLSSRFQLPFKLYGRDRELANLVAAFDRIAKGGRVEGVLVSGYSGIGKSSLIHELYKPIVRARGGFISGKFDQYRRNIPYATLLQAFQGLLQQILSESEESLAGWRRRLQDSLGIAAGVMAQVIPELELIVGKQPVPPELCTAESQNRFDLAFRSLIGVFANEAHPLVIFLDDMQWADRATLHAMESFLTTKDLSHLLFVLAYRDNETGRSHPFTLMIEEVKHSGAVLTPVQLGPLSPEDLNHLVSDSVHRPPEETRALADLLYAKTEGNPFFSGEFLKVLHADGVLTFEPESGRWTWNEEKIRTKDFAENVIDLMSRRLRRLPPGAQSILRVASAIGNEFDLETLAIATGAPAISVIRTELEEPLQEGLVTLISGATFRFQHDRIQQAAYALIEESERAEMHHRIGIRLLDRLSPEQIEARIFDVTNQLNLGAALSVDPVDRGRIARLNVSAGARAKASSAHATAEIYLAMAAQLFGESLWSEDFSAAFDLYRDLAESRYLSGHLEKAAETFANVLANARTALERADIYALQIRLFQVAGDYREALRICIHSFGDLGLTVPTTVEEANAAIGVEVEEAKRLLGDRRIPDLIDAPRMNEPRIIRLMALLEASGPPVYMVRPELFSWVALRMLNFSLTYGNIESSCYAYAIYALLLAAVFGEVDRAYAFSLLSIRLNEKFDDPKLKGCMLHMLGDHINFWKNPIATDLPILERGFRACIEGGDLIYSNYIGFQSIWHLWEKGEPLEGVLDFSRPYLAFADQSKHQANALTIRLEQNFVEALRGNLSRVDRMSSADLDETEALRNITEANYGCGVVYYQIMRVVLSYFAGEYAEALTSVAEAEKTLSAAFSMPIDSTFRFFRVLSRTALYSTASEPERAMTRSMLEETLESFARWSACCPENFAARHAILSGERARIAGRRFEAIEHYESGSQRARAEGYVQYEALANELCERLFRQSKIPAAAGAYALRAAELYSKWGARTKAREMTLRIPKSSRDRESVLESLELTTTSTSTHRLDLISVVKASQHISSEIELPKLFGTLMKIVNEYAGADRGVLLLNEGGELVVSAESCENASSGAPEGGTRGRKLPESILTYVRRTGQRVLLEEVEASGTFGTDPYLVNARPKSVLCLPIFRLGNLVGIFYLENRLVSGVFSPERLIVLDLLASQIAISIENSRLFKASQDSVRIRDEFLSIASHELKTPLTALKLRTQLMKRSLEREGAKPTSGTGRIDQFVVDTERSVERLTALLEDMLDVSSMSTGTIELRPEPGDLAIVIREEAGRLAPVFAQHHAKILLNVPEELFGRFDRARIGQVVRNLLLNAAKYGAGTLIRLGAEIEGDEVVLRVRDEGRGIAKGDQLRIFRSFERAISANEVSGMGLGLSIAQRILAMHGGTIVVESEIGHGATFTARFPVGLGHEHSV